MEVWTMKLKEIYSQKKAPCGKCPYNLGMIGTLVNPCPQCKRNGHKSYEWFQKQLAGEKKDAE